MSPVSKFLGPFAVAATALVASPVMAEVAEVHDDHFITKAEAVVEADRKATWLALISPARWWSSEHTWSADAANLRLTPQAGGCFCETIPETETPDGFTLQGSVEHMRVIQAYPEAALRMTGALGPLQSEPVTGILTIALSDEGEDEDGDALTRIVWEYNVAGKMRYPVPVISKAVDGVMTIQLTRLADLLGPVELPSTQEEPVEGFAAEDGEGGEDAAGDEAGELVGDELGAIEEAGGPSVEEAFEDLSGGPETDQGEPD